MPGNTPGTRIHLVALASAAFLVTAGILAARQTAAPAAAQSPPTGDEPESGAKARQPDRSKAKSKAKSRTDRSSKARDRRDPPGFYMGRPIAGVMSWEGADWLFRETRVEEEQPERMLEALKIPRGATVADVGAGAGYHSIRLARRVGPRGSVYATDVQPEMLRMLRENAQAARVSNIKPVRCTQADTGLPEGKIDLILMVDVYHECSDPEATLQGLRDALKPGGRLVLVEFRAEDPEVPIKPEHKMTLNQVRLELEPQGFTFKESLEFLPWQHIIIFQKPEEAKAEKDSKPGAGSGKDGASHPSSKTPSP